jgi:B12-binding domain/radical SAM domain protein
VHPGRTRGEQGAAPELALLFLYLQPNRYSFNALAGALAASPLVDRISVTLARTPHALCDALRDLAETVPQVLVGLSFGSVQILDHEALVRRLADTRPGNVTLVAGGPHASALPDHLLDLGVDLVVRGEGEQALLELVERLLDREPLVPLAGACWREGERTLSGSAREPSDLDSWPSGASRFTAVGPIEITRGCPYRCTYCQTPALFSGPVRHRSVDSVCAQIRDFRRDTFQDFRFIAPNAFGYGSPDARPRVERLEELFRSAAEAARPGRIFAGSFPSEVRPESVTDETVALVRRYGANDNLTVGLQSGHGEVLRSCRRGHSVLAVVQATERLRRADFKVNVDVIFGLPGEGETEAAETVRVLHELVAMGARIHAHCYLPLPGSALWPRPPSPLGAAARQFLGHGVGAGTVFGFWEHHLDHARRLLDTLGPYAIAT